MRAGLGIVVVLLAFATVWRARDIADVMAGCIMFWVGMGVMFT